MNTKMVLGLLTPGILLGILITFGNFPIFFIVVIWLMMMAVYPLMILAGTNEYSGTQAFMAVYICFTLMSWLPVEEYETFSAHSPVYIDGLNEIFRHPRKMIFIIGQFFALGSGVIAAVITVVIKLVLNRQIMKRQHRTAHIKRTVKVHKHQGQLNGLS